MAVDNRKINIYETNANMNQKIERVHEVIVGNVVMVETDVFQKDYFTAGQNISGHRIVYVQSGVIWPATPLNPNCFNRVVGIIQRSVESGESIVVKKVGTVYLSGWGLEQGKMYYLANGGMITAYPGKHDVVRQSVGFAISSNELALDFSISVKLN